MASLKDAAVLITGGSRGLGAALAETLTQHGARVVLAARHRAAIDEVVTRLRTRGGEAHGVVADIGDKDAVYPLAGAAAELVGPLDILVHNASELGPTPLQLLLDTPCEQLERVLAVNIVGPFRLTKIVAGAMALRGRGTVVHISSDAAVEAYPRWGAYSISKAALDHQSRIWAAELGNTGVRVFSVDPGEMDTEMHAAAMPDADRQGLARPSDVATKIVAMLSNAERIENGSRIIASKWEAPQ
jgi:NAD(P)-dependent dehydrogenase (short-subunit alcohol dehydrogenase family)